MNDSRQNIVAWANWGVANKAHFNYTEGPARMEAIGTFPIKFPVFADCSAAVTLWYWLAGAADPNGQNYDHEGYTGTLLSHGQHISLVDVKPGDVVVYGPGTGWHTALVVEIVNGNILTVSHGEQGDPSYVWANAPECVNPHNYPHDGREPQTYLRFNTATVGTAYPIPA